MTHARFSALLRAEATKAARQPATYVLAGILLGYAVLIVIALAGILAAPAGAGIDAGALLTPLRADAVGFLASILAQVSLILLVVFTAQLVAQEFARGTLRTLLLARARRADVAWSKLALLALACLGIALVVLAAGIAGAAVFSAASHERLLRLEAGPLARIGLRVLAALLAWAAIAFGTTLATRSLGVGIGATLGAMVAGDVLRGLLASLGTAGLWASRALPNAAIAAISNDAASPAAGDWAWIVPNLLAYVVALVLWALARLRRLDVIAATR